jgi:peptidase M28-like protein
METRPTDSDSGRAGSHHTSTGHRWIPTRWVLVVAALALIAGCGGSSPPPAEAGLHVDRFNRDRAFDDLRHQVELGPRPAKSEAARGLARWLRDRLPHGRIEKTRAGFENVVGRIGPERGKAIVVAAHYDTKDLPDFVGANDGAGGTAAVLEIARALRRTKGLPPIRFVLFDGEESPDDAADFYTTGLRGSRPYARRHAKRIRAMILLDFVAEKGRMRIPRESSSNIELWGRLRAAARRVGAQSAFPDEVSGGVIDDHTPFQRRGVPSIDLIDFTFDCWHKPCDDMSAVSARSLDFAGEAVTQMLLDFRK